MTDLVYCAALLPLSWAAVRDGKRRVIPNGAAISLLLLAVLRAWLAGAWAAMLFGLLLTGLPLLLAAVLWDTGIGGGDVKLCAALGALLGAQAAYAVIACSLLSLILWGMVRRRRTAPFAPFVPIPYFLILAFWIL